MTNAQLIGFVVVLTLVSAGVNFLLGVRLLAPFDLTAIHTRLAWAAIAVGAVLLPSTFLLLPRSGQPWADAVQWVGYLWMGVWSLIVIFSLARDLGWLVVNQLGALPEDEARRRFLLGGLNLGVLALSAGVGAAAYAGTRRLAEVVRVKLPIDDLPDALDGFTIAQISDLHVGPTIRAHHMEAIVARVNELDADLVALTGDLIDGPVAELASHVAPLKGLSSRHGTWFVTGNHEYYSGVHAWIAHVQGPLGMNVLLDEHAVLDHDGARVLLAGVTDRTARTIEPTHTCDLHKAVAGAPDDAHLKVLLAHQPESAPLASELGFHVQLSGHTHGGQYLPFTLLIKLIKKWVRGLYRVGRMHVYVNPGTTWWGPPMRLGAPQEITLLELTRA